MERSCKTVCASLLKVDGRLKKVEAITAKRFLAIFTKRRLVLAVIVAAVAEVLVQLSQVYRYSFDAYTHIFFADHYRRDWFSLWDHRWYGGFSVTTYPPLAHQLMALISFLSDPEIAYQVLAVVAHTSLTYSVYLYSSIFIGKNEAQSAALVAALLPAAGTTLNAFGQLPTLLATSLALIAAYKYNSYLTGGSVGKLVQASLWTATSGLTHHLTFLFFVPLTQLVILVRVLKTEGLTAIKRTLLYMLITSSMVVSILWPFMLFALTPRAWAEIPHGTRQDIFSSLTLSATFFWGMYSFTILLLSNAVAIAFRRRDLLPLFAVFTLLFILGLGGTTPIPRMIFGSLWQILTYDRFAFWAMIVYIPFLAVMVTDADIFSEKYFFGERTPSRNSRTKFILTAAFLAGLAASYIFASSAVVILGLQPPELFDSGQLDKIAKFLDSNSQWKYITLGFGNQRVLLSSKTSAATLDGGYNQAKTDPLLTGSGVESLDAAKHFPNGLLFLKKVLVQESNNGLRYVLSADEYYNPILRENGLRPIFTVDGARSVTVWEIPYSILKQSSSNPSTNPVVTALWSLGPVSILVAAMLSRFLEKALDRWGL